MIGRALRVSAATAARRTLAEPGGLFVTVFFYLSVVSVLGSLYPVMTVVLARVLLAERVRPVQEVGVGGVLCGVALIAAG